MINRKTILIPALLLVVAAAAQLPVLARWVGVESEWLNGQSFDDYHIHIGDRSFYLAGARSIHDFTIERKFNDKPQPILHQPRRVVSSDMPWYAQYVLAPYPNPAFKFGFSLSTALVTAPFPSRLFERVLPRLVLANFLFTLACLLLAYLIINTFVGNPLGAAIGCSLFVFDAWAAYTNYSYQSHTIAGLFFVLLAYYIVLKKERLTAMNMGTVAFLLVFSVFTSSHTVPIAAIMGLVLLGYGCLRAGWPRMMGLAAAALAGVLVLPVYILGVERLFRFRRLGIPPLFEQWRQYNLVVQNIIDEFPLTMRFIYDLRLYNMLAVPGACIVLYILFRQLQRRRAPAIEAVTVIGSDLKNKLLLFIIPFAGGLLVTALHNVPVTRSQVPYMVCMGLLLGVWLARRFVTGPRDVKAACLLFVALLAANFYLINDKDSIPGPGAPDCRIWANTLDTTRMTLKDFLQNKVRLSPAQKETCYVTFDGMDLIRPYADERRFVKKFVKTERDLVTAETYRRDFRLMNEILLLQQEGLLGKGDYKRVPKLIWDLRLWDGENYYMYGYLDRVKQYLRGSPLEALNARHFYYFRLKALEATLGKNLLTPGGIRVSSINSSAEDRQNMIDGNPGTYWHVKNPRKGDEEWVQVDFSEPTAVKALTVLPREGMSQLWTGTNAVWETSDDGASWKIVARLSAGPGASPFRGRLDFTLPDSAPSRHYRLRINDPAFYSIAELELYGR